MIPAIHGTVAAVSSSWTPANISTSLWLDASDTSTIIITSGRVSEWRDKSGNNRHFVQSNASNRPVTDTFSSRQVVYFDGNERVLTFNTAILTDNFFVAMVGMSNSDNSSNSGFISQNSGTFSQFRTVLYIEHQPLNRLMDIQIGSFFGQTQSVTYQWNLYGWWRSGTSTTLYHNTTAYTGIVNSGNAENTTVRLGTAAPTNNFFKGWIGELIVINNTTLSTSTRQQIEGYLAHKWSLTNNLPSNHPYKNSPPS